MGFKFERHFSNSFFCNFFLLYLSSSLLFLFQSSSYSLKNCCILGNEIPKDSVFSHTSVGYVFSYLLLILQVHPSIFVFKLLLHFSTTVFGRFRPIASYIFNIIWNLTMDANSIVPAPAVKTSAASPVIPHPPPKRMRGHHTGHRLLT